MSTAAGTENGGDTGANGQGPAAGDNANENPDPNADPNQDPNEDPNEDGEDESGFDAAKAKEALRKKNRENQALRKRATDAEAKAKDVDTKDTRITGLESENLRLRVGIKHGLPEALIGRLQGNTEEEILEDAEKLLELISPTKPPTNTSKERLRGGGDPTEEPEETDVAKLGEAMFRR